MAKCRQCGDSLPEGVRFCVACGCHNFDAGATLGAGHKSKLRSDQKQAQSDAWFLRIISLIFRPWLWF
jgi:hypothetical protein